MPSCWACGASSSGVERFIQITFRDGTHFIEMWDAGDFDPWETLRWPTVRVFRYRQHKPDGTINDAYWLTDFSAKRVGPRILSAFAGNRREIENEVFNDARNRYGFERIPHHDTNSLLLHWLLIFLTLCIERLYRLRYLHRGSHPPQHCHRPDTTPALEHPKHYRARYQPGGEARPLPSRPGRSQRKDALLPPVREKCTTENATLCPIPSSNDKNHTRLSHNGFRPHDLPKWLQSLGAH
jgi:hypothetical protein